MVQTVEDVINAVDTSALIARPLPEWRPILAEECHVYVFNENYIAKRFDQINYKFCEKNEAREILVDNLYALLRYKYFPKSSEEVDDKIQKIVSSFVANLKTTLKKISFDSTYENNVVKMLPNYCIAFRNGVFNFKDNKWLFKYTSINLKLLANTIYMYPTEYLIFWYFDYNFESLDIDIQNISLDNFVEIMKILTKDDKNYCFELLYNISHDAAHHFSFKKFEHLCEICGYTILQSFSQAFIMLIGAGQNGKNSLFDGCFSNRLVPRPAANDLDAIENDRFITGSLENKSHNIFLETSPKIYTESKMIKALTGSMYQTIESKGISKYSGMINCKYVFAGNDQEKIKFSDATTGFKRRINVYEIFYQWDPLKRYLSAGDYYETTFSDSLTELKDDPQNTSAYIYFGMYGIMSATKNFKRNFTFTYNDWNARYTDINLSIKDKIESITTEVLVAYMNKQLDEESRLLVLFDLKKSRLYLSSTLRELGLNSSYDEMTRMLADIELCQAYFSENDCYISVRVLQKIIKEVGSASSFLNEMKKLYSLTSHETIYNRAFIKCTFDKQKLRIIK